MTSVGERLVDTMASSGIEYVFGMPGAGSVLVYTAMHGRTAPRPVLTRQEHGATVMADAYARATGKPAVVLGEGAFITANGSFGLMEAMASSSPMVLVGDFSDYGMSPLPVSQSVTGDYGSPDAVAMLRAMTKYTAVASTPKEALLGFEMAMKHAVSGCPGPTALLIKSLAISGDIEEEIAQHPYSTTADPRRSIPVPAAEHLEAAVQLLADAERPVIVAGKGVHNAFAHAELCQLAERWGIPVATTYKGRSAIPETHPLALGMIGTFGRPNAIEVVRDADVVLVVGAKLRTNDTIGWTVVHPGQKIIQVDIETLNANWALPAAVTLIGDARAVLAMMLEARDQPAAADQVVRREAMVRSAWANDVLAADPNPSRDSQPVLPQRLARVLDEHLDPNSNISLDAGNNRIWMGYFWRVKREHSVYSPGGQFGMGWAIPAATGVKVGRPSEPSVAITGDGGFMMSVHALGNVVDAPTVTIVLNDSGLGMVRQHQGDRATASTFPDTDYAAIGRAFGLDGYRVSDSRELPDAIRAAQASGRGAVVDVVIDPDASPDEYRARPRLASET